MDNKDNSNLLLLSWHDSAWIPNLCPANIMDYFSERTNPFYDRTCNNEVIKMQRLNPEHLNNLTGLEYILLHCQEPILYVVRKQHRHSASQVTPLADYYIIAGVVYQAPDLGSIINSRVLSTIHHVQYAFEKTQSFSRYHPSKGYWWDFKEQETADGPKTKEKGADEPSSLFQRQRVDVLLGELAKKYPPKLPAPPAATTDNRPAPPPVQIEEPQVATQQPATGTPVPQTNSTQSQPLPKPVSEIKQEKPDTTSTTTATTTTSSSVTLSSVANTAVTATTTTTTTTASSVNNSQSNNKSSTKPPLEKRPRLMA